MSQATLDFCHAIADAATDKKAIRLVLMDLRGQSDVCDFQFICSGENDRQTRAIAEAIEAVAEKSFKRRPAAIEGKKSGHWILLDYGDVMVHIFFNYLRDYYAIEEIWPKAKYLNARVAPANP